MVQEEGRNTMAALKETNANRTAARTAVEDKGTTAKAKGPSPRQESDNTTQDQTEAAQPAPQVDIPLLVVCPNPKRANSIAHRHFENYGPKGELTTHREALARGVRGKDVSWDSDKNRCHILLGEDAVAFAALKTREEQTEFLRKYSGGTIKDATLIKWGYMDAPKPEEAAPAETAKTEEKAEA